MSKQITALLVIAALLGLSARADDCGVRQQGTGVRNGCEAMANILTISRIILALLLLRLPALSVPFAVLYVIAGLTDMLDGAITRKTGTVSKVGAKPDTAADFVFTVVYILNKFTGLLLFCFR